jgi:hypothetical protein
MIRGTRNRWKEALRLVLPEGVFDRFKDRFDYEVHSKDGKTLVENPTEGGAYIDPKTATPWVDIPRDTQRGDIRALFSGKSGTSEGDSWPPTAIQYVKGLRAKGMSVDQAVDAFKRYLLANRIPHFMSTHPGKKAYFEK